MKKRVFDNCSGAEIIIIRKKQLLESIYKMIQNNIITDEELTIYLELLTNTKTIKQINKFEEMLINTRKLEIHRRSFINYILDYKEQHLLTDYTKDICIKIINDVELLSELEEAETRIEEIIQEESKKIINEYNKIYNNLTFDDRKEEYLQKLKENLYLFEQHNITYHDDKTKMMKILLNPKNELELELCNTLIVYVQDIDYMTKNDLEIDYDNSLYLEVLTQLYNSYKNTDSKEKYEEIISKYDNPKSIAKIAYELICLGVNGVNDFIEVFAQKNNIDLTDDLEIQKLNICAEELNLKDNKKDLTEEEEMKLSIEFFKELHNEIINKDEKRK